MQPIRLYVVTAAFVVAALFPAVARANGWVTERNVLGGIISNTEWSTPQVSGDWVVFRSRVASPPNGRYVLNKVDLRTGVASVIVSSTTDGVGAPAVDGDWVAYELDDSIWIKNLATGTEKNITSANPTVGDPDISGKYVVWTQDVDWDAGGIHVWGRDFTRAGAPFRISADDEATEPSICGNRVAYRSGSDTIMVKTIGSSAPAERMTWSTNIKGYPSMGDHVLAWLETDEHGFWVIRYLNYDVGETAIGPSLNGSGVLPPSVSGDRIAYSYMHGSDLDLHVWDVRTRRASRTMGSFAVSNTDGNEIQGRISGNTCVYLANGWPVLARLVVPSLSVGSVPTRVPRRGHIHLRGTLSSQGTPIAGAPVRVERYSSSDGRWLLVKTVLTSHAGVYSYQSPALIAKTRYRVAYDGSQAAFNPGITQHLSAVSSVRTVWPR